MNTDAMLALASHIETVEATAFDMSEYYYPQEQNICGYAACVAGWAVLSDDNERARLETWHAGIGKGDDIISYPFHKRGATVLGLTEHQADLLFASETKWEDWLEQLGIDHVEDMALEDITSKHAVEVLRGLAMGELTFPRRWVERDY